MLVRAACGDAAWRTPPVTGEAADRPEKAVPKRPSLQKDARPILEGATHIRHFLFEGPGQGGCGKCAIFSPLAGKARLTGQSENAVSSVFTADV